MTKVKLQGHLFVFSSSFEKVVLHERSIDNERKTRLAGDIMSNACQEKILVVNNETKLNF